MTRKSTQPELAKPDFWTNSGATLGEMSTASAANAGLFADGFKAGYYGSKQKHAERRQQMRQYLSAKYGLQ